MTWSVVTAVLAALCFATAVVFQQEAAVEAQAERGSQRHSISGLAFAVLRRRVWLFATLVDFAGFLLQATALHLGRLTVVQPLLLLVLGFGMVLGAWRSHTTLGRDDLVGVVALCGGLAGFLAFAQPAGAGDETDALPGRLPLLIVSVLGLTLLGLVVSSRLGDTGRAGTLALVAGTCFACVAAIVKRVGVELVGGSGTLAPHGVGTVLSNWPVYALAVVALSGLAIEQAAFAAGPLVPTLVVLTLVDPLASLCTGVLVFGEKLQGGVADLAFASLFGLVAIIGVVLVARSRATATVQAPAAILAHAHAG